MKLFDFFKKADSNKKAENKPEQYDVLIPDERFYMAEAKIEGKIHVCMLNAGIMDLNHKEVFGWYLSVIIFFDKTVGEDMPTQEDTIRMQDFCDTLSRNLAVNPTHPNALLLGRITGNGQTHVMWYVNNPETANEYLQSVISSKDYPLQFEYEMTFDGEWKEAHYWLDSIDKK